MMALSRSAGATDSTAGTCAPERMAIDVAVANLRSVDSRLHRESLFVDIADTDRAHHSREQLDVTVVLVKGDDVDRGARRRTAVGPHAPQGRFVAELVDLEPGSGEARSKCGGARSALRRPEDHQHR